MIEWKNTQITIKRQCELLDLFRSTAYHTPVETKPSEDDIVIKMQFIEFTIRNLLIVFEGLKKSCINLAIIVLAEGL